MTQKSSTLDNLEGSLHTVLCQPCSVVAKRYIVGGWQWYYWMG